MTPRCGYAQPTPSQEGGGRRPQRKVAATRNQLRPKKDGLSQVRKPLCSGVSRAQVVTSKASPEWPIGPSES